MDERDDRDEENEGGMIRKGVGIGVITKYRRDNNLDLVKYHTKFTTYAFCVGMSGAWTGGKGFLEMLD